MNDSDKFLYAILTEIYEKLDDPMVITDTDLDPGDSNTKKVAFERLSEVWNQVCPDQVKMVK